MVAGGSEGDVLCLLGGYQKPTYSQSIRANEVTQRLIRVKASAIARSLQAGSRIWSCRFEVIEVSYYLWTWEALTDVQTMYLAQL